MSTSLRIDGFRFARVQRLQPRAAARCVWSWSGRSGLGGCWSVGYIGFSALNSSPSLRGVCATTRVRDGECGTVYYGRTKSCAVRRTCTDRSSCRRLNLVLTQHLRAYVSVQCSAPAAWVIFLNGRDDACSVRWNAILVQPRAACCVHAIAILTYT